MYLGYTRAGSGASAGPVIPATAGRLWRSQINCSAGNDTTIRKSITRYRSDFGVLDHGLRGGFSRNIALANSSYLARSSTIAHVPSALIVHIGGRFVTRLSSSFPLSRCSDTKPATVRPGGPIAARTDTSCAVPCHVLCAYMSHRQQLCLRPR